MRIGRTLVTILRDFAVACWEVFKLPVVLIGIGFSRFFGLGARNVLIFVAAAVIVTIVAAGALVQATSQPGFCVTCHVMEPYFEAWRTSTHNNVSCVTCHVPPGVEGTIKHKFMAASMVANYMTGLYKRSKPWAEIDDASCLRSGCHDTRLLKGTEDFKGVLFDHRPHLEQTRRDRQLRCTSCHAQIVQGEHISVTEGTCFLCHFRPDSLGRPTDLARCTHCHRPPVGPAAADTAFDHTAVLARGVECLSCHATAVAGDGYVPPERCSSCHAKVEHIERYGDREFVHAKHVTEHKVECLQCHIAIRHGRAVAAEKESSPQCAACHGLPDNAIEAVWKGELPGVKATPSAMAKSGMSCSSCHVEPVHRGAGQFAAPVCTPCHEASYDRLWRMWEAPLRQAARELGAQVRRARRLSETERDTLLHALDIYQRGNPVHNPDLLAALTARVTGEEGRSGRCATCHPAAENSEPVWNGRAVPHRTHAAKQVTCETCHVAEQARHGALTSVAMDCNACHHRTASEERCALCHTFQNAVYRGTLDHAAPSAMAAAEIACTDCHTLEQGRAARGGGTCASCHDESYADTLRVWQAWSENLPALRQRASGEWESLAAAVRRDGSRTAHNPPLFHDWAKRIEVTP